MKRPVLDVGFWRTVKKWARIKVLEPYAYRRTKRWMKSKRTLWLVSRDRGRYWRGNVRILLRFDMEAVFSFVACDIVT